MSDPRKTRPWLAALAWAAFFGFWGLWFVVSLVLGQPDNEPGHLTGWPLLSRGLAAFAIGAAFGLAAEFLVRTGLGQRSHPGETDAQRQGRRKTRSFRIWLGMYFLMSIALSSYDPRPAESMAAAFAGFMVARGLLASSSISRDKPIRHGCDVAAHAQAG